MAGRFDRIPASVRFGFTATASGGAIVAALLLAGPACAQDAPQAPATRPDSAAISAGPDGSAEGKTDGEIIVTGSRLANAGFNAPTPVTVVGGAEIARQAAPNIAEVLNQVPSFRAQNTPATSAIFLSNIGASTADLRSLGANRTLVLIDGRRVVPATVQGGSFTPANTVDLNLVPTSLIQRSEVVTGGASAAYGSDAVAGVVNLILNKDLTGFRGNVQYGITEQGDTGELLVSLAGGQHFAGDRGRIVTGVEYVDNKGSGDCYSRDWCARSYNTVSNPANVGGLAKTLILPNTKGALATRGGIITSGPLRGTEFGPGGTTFQHNYGTYYGAGLFQSGGGPDTRQPFYENYPISAPVERYNAFTHIDFAVSDAISLFAEGSYGHVVASTLGAQRRDLGSITIRGDNAFLPAAIAAAIGPAGSFGFGRIGDDLGAQIGHVKRETGRLVGGFEGKLGRFSIDGYYQYGRTNYDQRGENTTITPRFLFAVDAVRAPSGQIVCRAALAGNPAAAGCVPYNIFGENNFSAAAKAYVTGTARQSTELTQQVASTTLHGDLVDLWAGPLTIATGVEFRQDKARGTADPISTALQFYTSPGAAISGKINVKEGFFEAGLPLLKDMTLAKSLALNAAVRVTDYSTSGTVTTWKAGITYEPTDWLRFRGTRSRDIRAPNVFELYGPIQSSFQSINDPKNNNVQGLPTVLLGGNPDLKPEVARTYTAGVVLTPNFGGPGRLRLAVDYFDINLKGAIATLGGQIVVNRCAAGDTALCQFVTRAGGTATGQILSVSNFNLNLNRLITRGVDVEGSYSMPISAKSSVSLRVLGTYVKDLITVDSSGVRVDRAGMDGSPVSQPSGVPRYQINSYLSYDGDPFSAQVQLRYIAKGRYNTTLIGPDQDGYSPTLANSISDNSIPSRLYVNVNGQVTVFHRDNQKAEMYFAVNNLFDKDPPVAPSSFGPTNNVLYDVLGRSFRVGFRFAY